MSIRTLLCMSALVCSATLAGAVEYRDTISFEDFRPELDGKSDYEAKDTIFSDSEIQYSIRVIPYILQSTGKNFIKFMNPTNNNNHLGLITLQNPKGLKLKSVEILDGWCLYTDGDLHYYTSEEEFTDLSNLYTTTNNLEKWATTVVASGSTSMTNYTVSPTEDITRFGMNVGEGKEISMTGIVITWEGPDAPPEEPEVPAVPKEILSFRITTGIEGVDESEYSPSEGHGTQENPLVISTGQRLELGLESTEGLFLTVKDEDDNVRYIDDVAQPIQFTSQGDFVLSLFKAAVPEETPEENPEETPEIPGDNTETVRYMSAAEGDEVPDLESATHLGDVYVTVDDIKTAVSVIASDGEEEVWYDIQGRRVQPDRMTEGIYIRRAGSAATLILRR